MKTNFNFAINVRNSGSCITNIIEFYTRFGICLLRPVSQATQYFICFPRIVVVMYMKVDLHSTYHCDTVFKNLLLCALYTNLSHLTTNLFYMYLCIPCVL